MLYIFIIHILVAIVRMSVNLTVTTFEKEMEAKIVQSKLTNFFHLKYLTKKTKHLRNNNKKKF